MCETGNKYGHPHRETLASIQKRGIQAYRTDLDGTIVMTSDGETLSIKTEKESA